MSEPRYDRDASLAWLLALTALPTAAGRERRVIEWIEGWAGERDDLRLTSDGVGNLVIEHAGGAAGGGPPPLFITGHLDHPAFVVDAAPEGREVRLSFRGGVKDPYFRDAPIVLYTSADRPVRARVVEAGPADPFRACRAVIDDAEPAEALAEIGAGDVGRWDLPEPEIDAGVLRTHACDDLAAVCAALTMMDALRPIEAARHVRLLLTRAEEVGFAGAIAACRAGTMPAGSRAVLLENSRSFAESPLGGGPIVRVGDRLSTFSPALTGGIGKVAEALAKEREASAGAEPFRWQRKLMPGGACEATCFLAYGYEAACLCLPLGNYHNMADLAEVESGEAQAVESARAGREFIHVSDFFGLVDLLIACATRLGGVESMRDRLDGLFEKTGHVLREG